MMLKETNQIPPPPNLKPIDVSLVSGTANALMFSFRSSWNCNVKRVRNTPELGGELGKQSEREFQRPAYFVGIFSLFYTMHQ